MFCDQKYAVEFNSCLYQFAYGNIGFDIHHHLKSVSKNLMMMLNEDFEVSSCLEICIF